MSEPIRILYVDDYPLDRELVLDALEKEHGGFKVVEAASRAEFEARLAAHDYELVLSDFNILGFEGLQVLDTVRAKAPRVPVVIVTGTGSEEIAVEAMKRGAADYVIKTPKHIQRLPQTIHAVIEKQRIRNEYQRAMDALAEEHHLLRTLIDNVPDYIFVKDSAGRFLLNNIAHVRLLGAATPSEVVGKTDFDYFPPALAAQHAADEQEIIQSGQPFVNREESITDQAGNQRWLLSTKAPLRNSQGEIMGLVGTSHDITQRKRLEAEFIQAQKMESIGRLAGGVAHDFNNLLTVITSYAYLAIDKLPPGDSARGDLQEIQKAAARATDLVRQLLTFARRPIVEPRALNLNDLIVDIEKTLHGLISEDIELVTLLAPGLGQIKADPGQIAQVLVNLVVNARDAMPDGGKLTIETGHVTFDPTDVLMRIGIIAGRYVLLAISDTGMGMTEEVRQHIFEPFFTTKQPDRGTGLGLSICYGIVTQHRGSIEVNSTPGHGTTFTIYLPHVETAAEG
jgi:PAS domain S-box-containing protein